MHLQLVICKTILYRNRCPLQRGRWQNFYKLCKTNIEILGWPKISCGFFRSHTNFLANPIKIRKHIIVLFYQYANIQEDTTDIIYIDMEIDA